MPWLQLKIITTRRYAESLEDSLLASGAASVTLQDNADQPILEPGLGETPLWDSVRITGLFDAEIDTAKTIAIAQRRFGNPLPEHFWEQLEDKDWEREWMANYHAIRCGERLWICPSWQQPPEPDKVNLMLDPGLAFGTGTHPTTFLCMQWIDQQDFTDKEVIDYGCGSGILALAAAKLGAARVTGTDIDPHAMDAARYNAERNGATLELLHSRENIDHTADVVVANILANPLTVLAPLLCGLTRSGGRIALSGILAAQTDMVRAAYRPAFELEVAGEREGWVLLTGTRV